jgi:hypothetical protein
LVHPCQVKFKQENLHFQGAYQSGEEYQETNLQGEEYSYQQQETTQDQVEPNVMKDFQSQETPHGGNYQFNNEIYGEEHVPTQSISFLQLLDPKMNRYGKKFQLTSFR